MKIKQESGTSTSLTLLTVIYFIPVTCSDAVPSLDYMEVLPMPLLNWMTQPEQVGVDFAFAKKDKRNPLGICFYWICIEYSFLDE